MLCSRRAEQTHGVQPGDTARENQGLRLHRLESQDVLRRLRRQLPRRRRRCQRPVLRRHAGPREGAPGLAQPGRHALPTALQGEEVQPAQVPGGVLDVPVERLLGLLQGVRRGHPGPDARHPRQAEERRERVRHDHGGEVLQHRVVRSGLHALRVDGLGAVLHGLRRRPAEARAARRPPGPRRREVPRAPARGPAAAAGVQHPEVRRRRGLHRAPGPRGRPRRQRLPEEEGLRGLAVFRAELDLQVPVGVLWPGADESWGCPVRQRFLARGGLRERSDSGPPPVE
mmetsp:Transcript_38972/g.111530  ORF Transcript_38972/g.111530 Transcript_38972/m.111530 type:complete len:285 (+) Transcript_38972:1215-2069(+)